MTTRDVRAQLDSALQRARDAMDRSDYEAAWPDLERAHVLAQPSAREHVQTHWVMLVCGFRQRDIGEVLGQVIRLIVAAPASVLGVYPRGNTGRANVSAFRPMPMPEDLRRLLDPE
jgi:Protein of unknown function (DUF3703)